MFSCSLRLHHHYSKYIDNPYRRFTASLQSFYGYYQMYGLAQMNDPKVDSLPFCIRIMLENVMRHCDQFEVKSIDVLKVLNWQEASKERIQIPFKPSRVLLQDFTGLFEGNAAAMRDAMKDIGGDPELINPQCPVHLVIDHSIQTEVTKTKNPAPLNEKIEFDRNQERFEFLKWGSRTFKNLKIIPPGGGISHQINLEYLAEVVSQKEGFVFPDTVVGSDPHTSMINGLGVLGWGVGGLEAEAVMLGQPIPILLPKVIGVKLLNGLKEGVSAADLVLTLTKQFKNSNVKNKYLEFYGPGVDTLTVPERATVANMANQYGATVAYFPVDRQTIKYLQKTGRDLKMLNLIENTLTCQKIFKNKKTQEHIKYSSTMQIDLQKIEPSVAGPKRPFDWISLSNLKVDWRNSLLAEKGVKQFGVDKDKAFLTHKLKTKKYQEELKHGSVILASIDSCTNTVNPKVMIAAGLLAKKAVAKGLKIKKYIKASMSPGSLVVSEYLKKSRLIQYFNLIGFEIAGYGCMTCIGNSGEIQKQINDLVKKQDLIVCSVTSGNTNYQSKLHRRVKANYLMSPVYVVAYSIAGTVDIDFQTQPIGYSQYNNPIFLKDLLPKDQEVKQVIDKSIDPQMYQKVYDTIYSGTKRWSSIMITPSIQYQWKKQSTFIQKPPYLENITRKPKGIQTIKNAFALAYFGDQITTDLISPSGRILKNSLTGKHLQSKNIDRKDFNTYGSRRGNFDVLTRGTFSNPIIINRLSPVVGPKTTFIPTGQVLDFLQASQKYKQLGHSTLIIAGTQYGKGATKDWAARGPYLLGVRAVIAQSYDEKHRLSLIEIGILPLEFMPEQSAEKLLISGKETFTINIPDKNLERGQVLSISTNTGKDFQCRSRLDSELQIQYYRHGGILPYNLRKLKNKSIQQ